VTGSRYAQGVRIEHLVADDLKANGYRVTRAASSKGICDLVCLKQGELLLISVKRTTMPGPAERHDLRAAADLLPGVGIPLVALKPLRQPIEYRRLTGDGPRDWQPWTPDWAIA
jgi:Holliday junction resolvase